MSSTDPRQMSQRELDDYLDRLVARGEDEKPTARFVAAFDEYERRDTMTQGSPAVDPGGTR